MFNVGQGDNLLLKLPNGKFGIIDFFFSEKSYLNQREPPALTFLKKIQKWFDEKLEVIISLFT